MRGWRVFDEEKDEIATVIDEEEDIAWSQKTSS